MRLMWFRRDLRLEDNTAFTAALKAAESDGSNVQPIFIFDRNILDKLEDKDDARLSFIHSTIESINQELKESGCTIKTYYGRPIDVFKQILKDDNFKSIYTNRDYEPYALERDGEIANWCSQNKIEFQTFKDQVIFEKSEVVKADGKPYTVFTPYKRTWLKTVKKDSFKTLSYKKHSNFLRQTQFQEIIPLKKMGFKPTSLEFPKRVIQKKTIENYHEQRDFPAIEGTSLLGIHLRFGTISPRKCQQIATQLNETWQSELVWREFFMQILYHFPHVVNQSFRKEYDNIPWRNQEGDFEKWCEGNTGYPLVDAGMRELNTTGYMHNRVRMLVASFLTKHLLIDWRWGERYFARKLLDFDLSANNGNWQWAAGTGCDAAPYFRIFNPETQIKKFDSKYEYISKWVPEWDTKDYPSPMVDHKMARERALATYKKGLGKS